MNLNNILTVFFREFIFRLKSKSFWLILLLIPLIPVIIGGIFFLVNKVDKVETVHIAVYDPFNHLNKLENSESLNYEEISNKELEKIYENRELGKYFGIVEVEENFMEKGEIILSSTNPISKKTSNELKSDFEKIVHQTKFKALEKEYEIPNLSERLSDLNKPIKINEKSFQIDADATSDDSLSSDLSVGLAYIFAFLMYLLVLTSGSTIMQGVIQEKTSRVMELLLCSVKALDLLIGKFLAYISISIFKIAIWFLFYLLIVFLMGSYNAVFDNMNIEQTGGMFDSQAIIIRVLLNFILFFIPGFLFYASMFVAVGSAVDTPEEAGQLTFPIMLPFIISFLLAVNILENPYGNVAWWASMIPFTSPICMMVRIPFGVHWSEILLSFSILIVSTCFILWAASKIYRTGVLMYGKKITFKELFKWLKY